MLFALSCLGLPELLTGGRLSTMPSTLPAADGTAIAVPPLDIPAWLIAAGVVNWLLGLAIIILLWQPAANRYYEAVSLSRRRPAYPPYAAPGYGAPGYAPPGYAPPGSPQWQPHGQPPQIRRTRRRRHARPRPDAAFCASLMPPQGALARPCRTRYAARHRQFLAGTTFYTPCTPVSSGAVRMGPLCAGQGLAKAWGRRAGSGGICGHWLLIWRWIS